MTSHEAFLAAIVANPRDDLPRLVYADYLDEIGESPRANFIRWQIAGAQGDTQAARQAEELLTQHKEQWQIPQLRGGQFFRRGFVDELQIWTEEFVTHAERIGASAPVVGLTLANAGPHRDAIVRISWLHRLEKLDLTNNWGIRNWLDELLAAIPLPELRTLELRNNQLFADTLPELNRHLARSPHLARLNLSGNPLGDDGMEALLPATSLAGLNELIVRCDMLPYTVSIHAQGAAALARNPRLRQLRTLDLAGHYIGDAGFQELIQSPNFPALETMDVSNNELGAIGDSGLEALANSTLPRLKVLRLGRNRIGSIGAQILADWSHWPNMEQVDLTGCEWDGPALSILQSSPYLARMVIDEPVYSV